MTTTAPQKPPRLRFIDMARSVAILLMLEGHFIDDSLLPSARDPDHPVYAAWSTIRLFTAPMFLTVTGLIFAYLLMRHDDGEWFLNPRLHKGLGRIVELFLWGYIVQSYAFHILECIACGLATILLLYAIQKWVRVIPLACWLVAAALVLFLLTPAIRQLPLGMSLVEQFWWWINVPLYGTETPVILFPVFPFVGFTLCGAAIGCIAYRHRNLMHTWWLPCLFALGGALLYFGAGPAFSLFAQVTDNWGNLASTASIYRKLGMVLMTLSILMFVDYHSGHRIRPDSLFLKIGQNTLLIYVLHMFLLYGSITAVGLNQYFHQRLNPWQAALGAALFIAFFVALVHYLERIQAALNWVWTRTKRLVVARKA